MNRAMVFYNSKEGYFFASYAKARGLGYLVVINPVITANDNAEREELVGKIEEAFEISKANDEIDYDLKNKYCFWQNANVKNFKEFCRKFNAVEIIEKDGKIYLYKQEGNRNGTYTRSELEDECIEFEAGEDFSGIAEGVLKLLGKESVDGFKNSESFITLGRTQVKYNVPSDALEDCEDGGTDAYKIFRENETGNYIAFLIDNGYTKLNEIEIRNVLERQFGKFSTFSFCNSDPKRLVINAQNEKCIIESNIFILEEEFVELQLYQNVAKQGIISSEYRKIIDTVEFQMME